MSLFSDWQHRWISCPNTRDASTTVGTPLIDWIDSGWSPLDKSRLLGYLSNSPVHFHCFSEFTFCALCDEPIQNASDWRWDGEWLWQDDLYHFVSHHFVRLPDLFVERIRTANYYPPSQTSVDFSNAESVYQDFYKFHTQ